LQFKSNRFSNWHSVFYFTVMICVVLFVIFDFLFGHQIKRKIWKAWKRKFVEPKFPKATSDNEAKHSRYIPEEFEFERESPTSSRMNVPSEGAIKK